MSTTPQQSAALESSRVLLAAASISVLRGTREVCRDVSLEVVTGECVGILGPNGSGKSSLLLGLRAQLPTRGLLELDGIDPRTVARRQVARHVAVMPQRFSFSMSLTVEEMLLLGRSPYRHPWQGFDGEDYERLDCTLQQIGLPWARHHRVDELSGGERRKVFLGRALMQGTPLLFLDEPMAGLDPQAQGELIVLLRELQQQGKGILAVLHDVRWAQLLCSRVLGLRDSESHFWGAADQVIDEAGMQELYGGRWQRYTDTSGGTALLPELGSTSSWNDPQ